MATKELIKNKALKYNKSNNINKVMAAIAYLFVPIPLIFGKKSKFLKYHLNQGINLFVCEVLYGVLYYLLFSFTSFEEYCNREGFYYRCGRFIIPLGIRLLLLAVGCGLLLATIIGIKNVIRGKLKPIPFIGRINLLKNYI